MNFISNLWVGISKHLAGDKIRVRLTPKTSSLSNHTIQEMIQLFAWKSLLQSGTPRSLSVETKPVLLISLIY